MRSIWRTHTSTPTTEPHEHVIRCIDTLKNPTSGATRRQPITWASKELLKVFLSAAARAASVPCGRVEAHGSTLQRAGAARTVCHPLREREEGSCRPHPLQSSSRPRAAHVPRAPNPRRSHRKFGWRRLLHYYVRPAYRIAEQRGSARHGQGQGSRAVEAD